MWWQTKRDEGARGKYLINKFGDRKEHLPWLCKNGSLWCFYRGLWGLQRGEDWWWRGIVGRHGLPLLQAWMDEETYYSSIWGSQCKSTLCHFICFFVMMFLWWFLWWFPGSDIQGDSMHMLLSYEASRHWLERDWRGQELKQSNGGHCALRRIVL